MQGGDTSRPSRLARKSRLLQEGGELVGGCTRRARQTGRVGEREHKAEETDCGHKDGPGV